MITENSPERRRTNTEGWHRAGFTGKGIHIVVFDEKGSPHSHMDYAVAPFCGVPRVSHATNVSQVIHEFAPDAKITMLYSIEDCRQWFKTHANEIDLVNISMGATRPGAEHSWGFLEDYDIPVICASGNYYKTEVSYPAAFPWTIAVGAFEDRSNAVAHYSNGGDMLDLVGFTDIYVLSSDKGLIRFNGTSAASPQVTGSVACYLQYLKESNVSYTRESIRSLLHSQAIDIGEEGIDTESGYGLMRLPSLDRDINEEVVDKMAQLFKDIAKDRWSHDAIAQAKERGIAEGFSDGTFRPLEKLSREQGVVMLNRTINFILGELDKHLPKT